MEADRFTIGRGKEFATQETMIWSEDIATLVSDFWNLERKEGWQFFCSQADTAPMGIRNMAKKRAPTLVVAVAMALPTAATSMRQMM